MSESSFPKINNPNVRFNKDYLTDFQNDTYTLTVERDLMKHILETEKVFDSIDERILVSVLLSRGYMVIPAESQKDPDVRNRTTKVLERHGISFQTQGDTSMCHMIKAVIEK